MNSLLLRAVLFAALLFALNAWALRHMQSSIGDLLKLNGFTAFVMLVLGWLDNNIINQQELKLKKLLGRMLTTSSLASLYVIAIVGTSLWTSVTVLADGEAGPVTVTVTTADGNARKTVLNGPGGVAHLGFFANPFGMPVDIKANGFQQRQFALQP